MVDIVKYYGWSYVATVATDEDYGRLGVEGFHEEAKKQGICISTQRLFNFNIRSEDTMREIEDIVRELKADTKTNVIVLFCEYPRAVAVLEEAQKQGMKGKTWIATEAWGFSSSVYDLDMSVVGGVLGVVTHAATLPIFETYLSDQNLSTTNNPWLLEYFRTKSCKIGETDCKIDPKLNAGTLTRSKSTYVMDAIYTVVLALRKYMECGKTDQADCLKNIDLERLREYMMNVSANGTSGRNISYDTLGNPAGRSDLWIAKQN